MSGLKKVMVKGGEINVQNQNGLLKKLVLLHIMKKIKYKGQKHRRIAEREYQNMISRDFVLLSFCPFIEISDRILKTGYNFWTDCIFS